MSSREPPAAIFSVSLVPLSKLMLSPDASKAPADPGALAADRITPGILPTGTRSCALFSTPPGLDPGPVIQIGAEGAEGVEGADEPIEPDEPDDPPLGAEPPPGDIISLAELCAGPVTEVTAAITGTCLPSFSTA